MFRHSLVVGSHLFDEIITSFHCIDETSNVSKSADALGPLARFHLLIHKNYKTHRHLITKKILHQKQFGRHGRVCRKASLKSMVEC